MATRRCFRVAISRVWRDSLPDFYAMLVKLWRIEGEEDRHFAWIQDLEKALAGRDQPGVVRQHWCRKPPE